MHFYIEIQQRLVIKVLGLVKMHISTKNEIMVQKLSMEPAQTKVKRGRKPSEPLLGAIFCEDFFMKPWYAMFGIYPRCYITYRDRMRCFSIFFDFLILFAPISNLGQTHGACHMC
jgi:hypothetical protein